MKRAKHEQPSSRRRRGDALIQAIYAAVLGELADAGFGHLTMDRIALRARTGKMPLYRRWASVQELVLDALTNALEENTTHTPDTGNLREDLIEVHKNIRELMNSPVGTTMRAIIGDRLHHPDLIAAIRTKIFEPHSQILQVLERSTERGEIRREVITPQVCQAGRAMMIMQQLLQGSSPDDTEIVAIVDRILLPALGVHGPTEDAPIRR
ncbi:TetR/AcrR family transcriptional regulator [Ktedonosporobacter rubrisoli]|uniref:TetR/AcrR family transcriptional regulator n=1 Tax=Ktedonosporobacter rubrisoli TaxID=2509675 RepID=A0A4P6JN78_KTERU|nr:TetR/AcrR family transcriptional regulator [Ktedonosporobacter rubrisoli]QBD76540.1 TetR/AcrR family transcriptional regulator [Ktedonosporobacter rubrisoli]